MNKINYLYIDDEDEDTIIQAIAKGFSDGEQITVTVVNPTNWREQIHILEAVFAKPKYNQSKTSLSQLKLQADSAKKQRATIEKILLKHQQFDGLILDLRLDLAGNMVQEIAHRGLSLAQELRTLSTEQIIRDIPIILCSASEKLEKSYQHSDTAHNLFDQGYNKDLTPKKFQIARQELIALAEAYRAIKVNRNDWLKILAIDDAEDLNYQIPYHFKHRLQQLQTPIHEWVRFILRQIILSTGPLIKEEILAARLGVSIAESTDWEKLKNEILADCKYKGVLSSAWKRWWMYKIKEWWATTFPNEQGLAFLTAKERVSLLQEKTKLVLTPAQKTKYSRTTDFWTVCAYTNQPLTIDDSILLNKSDLRYPWQEDTYCCVQYALENEPEIHPLEVERLKKLKKMYTRARN